MVEMIKKLKEDLQKEVDENRALRENLEFMQNTYNEQNEKFISENKDLKTLTQKLTLV